MGSAIGVAGIEAVPKGGAGVADELALRAEPAVDEVVAEVPDLVGIAQPLSTAAKTTAVAIPSCVVARRCRVRFTAYLKPVDTRSLASAAVYQGLAPRGVRIAVVSPATSCLLIAHVRPTGRELMQPRRRTRMAVDGT